MVHWPVGPQGAGGKPQDDRRQRKSDYLALGDQAPGASLLVTLGEGWTDPQSGMRGRLWSVGPILALLGTTPGLGMGTG